MPVALHHETLGEARPGEPPVLVAHGLFGSIANWRSVARRLSAGHRVITVDMRNHGRSPHTGAMSYPEMAGDLAALLDALGVEAASVVGHSMGGKAAMRLALDHPARVARLCVVDIAPLPSPGDHSQSLAAMRSLALGEVRSRADADRALARRIEDPGLRAFLLQNLQSGESGYAWRVNLAAIEARMADLLDFPLPPEPAPYPGPALFVRGAASDYLTDAHRAPIRALFPRARMATIKRAGHWVHAEQPEAFLAVLEPFLAAGTGAAAG